MNLVLQLTGHCNLRCRYCYFKHLPYEGRMSVDVAEQSIRFAFARSLELGHRHCNFTFFGGEPLLEKQLLRHCLHFAQTHRPERLQLGFAINTNGTLLDRDILQDLQGVKARIYLSLDGPPELHNAQRPTCGGGPSFHLLEPWLAQLAQLDTYVIQVLEAANAHLAGEALFWITQQGLRNIISAPNYNGEWTDDRIDALAESATTFAQFWLDEHRAGRRLYWNVLNDKIRHLLENSSVKQSSCSVGLGGLAVNPLGRLFPCTHFLDLDPEAPWDIGSVSEGLDTAATNTLSHHLRTQNPECGTCPHLQRCHAQGCSCIAWSTTSSLGGIDPQVCAMEKRLIPLADHFAAELLSESD